MRADASAEIGTGHVMRCIALAQALKRRVTPSVFVTSTTEGRLLERLRSEASFVVSLNGETHRTDVAFTASVAQAHDAEWIVVDGYEFGPEYRMPLRATGHRVLYIDDIGHGPFECDVVLNQNLHGLDASYSTAAHTRLLLGRNGPDGHQGALGYCFAKSAWGRGIATESAREILRFGFEELGLHRVWAGCDTENAGSIRVLEKLGMTREAHHR